MVQNRASFSSENISISEFVAFTLSEGAADFGSARIRLGEKESAVVPYHRPLLVTCKTNDQGGFIIDDVLDFGSLSAWLQALPLGHSSVSALH